MGGDRRIAGEAGSSAKTPDNSSLPPSQGHKKATEFVKNRKKRKPHPGAHRALHPNPTHRRDVLADVCGHCGADVSLSQQEACEVYDRIEIPPVAPEITRVSLHGGVCPCCAKRFKARAPAGLEPGSPFGPNLRALVIYLRFTQGVAFERLSRLMTDLFGLSISEGALVNILSAARQRFAAESAAIRAKLLSGTVICSDETGLRVGKRSWWLWVFHHGENAFFLTHPRRSKEAVEAFLGDVRPQVWVADRYGAQAGWATKDQQACLAHLLRDTQYVIEEGDGVFAPAFRHFIGMACDEAERRDAWNDATLNLHKRRLEAELDRVLAVTPVHRAGIKWKSTIENSAPTSSSSCPTATFPRPTINPSAPCALAPPTGKSPTASAPSGAQNNTPTSAPSSKPAADSQSTPSKPSEPPSPNPSTPHSSPPGRRLPRKFRCKPLESLKTDSEMADRRA